MSLPIENRLEDLAVRLFDMERRLGAVEQHLAGHYRGVAGPVVAPPLPLLPQRLTPPPIPVAPRPAVTQGAWEVLEDVQEVQMVHDIPGGLGGVPCGPCDPRRGRAASR